MIGYLMKGQDFVDILVVIITLVYYYAWSFSLVGFCELKNVK